MPNPYPFELSVGGVVKESGDLTFTDSGNQPGGGAIALIGNYSAEILYNADNTGPGYTYDVFGIPVFNSGPGVSTFVIPNMAISMGQTLKMIAKDDAASGLLHMAEGALTVASADGAEWLSVYKFSSAQALTGSYTPFVFDTGNDPAPRGSNLTWNGTDTITAGADLIVTVSGKLIISG